MIFLALKTEDGRITGKISFYCRMLGISRQGFYKYLTNKDRPWKYQDLADAMKEIISEDECNDTYGRIRMYQALLLKQPEGVHIPSERTVYRVMDQIGLSHRPRRKPNGLTKADREAMKSDDLLKRDFHSDAPLEKCITDITEIPASNGKLYVSAIFDCFDSFLGKVQLEVVCSLLVERYHVNINVKEPTVIYLERPLKTASYTIHIEVPPNPFWASIGLTVTPLPAGSGTRFKSKVSLGYLNQSFQNAVMEGVRYGMEQGLYGWEVTDCEICFDYGVYYSPVSTPADFRSLAPIVLEQALKRAGTQLLEPYLSFTLFAPQEYISRAYNDAPKYCAVIESTLLKNDEVIFTGEIPARCIGEYRNDLNFYTNGRSVCLTELKGYQEISGEPVLQPRRPNSRLDKVRHMFQKIT